MKLHLLLIILFNALIHEAQSTITNSIVAIPYLKLERDIIIPIKLEHLNNELGIWKENLGPNWKTEWPQFQETILNLEEEQKSMLNILNELLDTALWDHRTEVETEFKSLVMADEKLMHKYSNLWDRLSDLAEERGQLEIRKQFYSDGGLALLNAAINMVRSCDPNETMQNRALATKVLENYSTKSNGYPINDNLFGRALFIDHIDRAQNWLSEGDPYLTKVFNGNSGQEFLEFIYGEKEGSSFKSLVAFSDQRDSILNLGWHAIQKNDDPAIVAARELVILSQENKTLGDTINQKEKDIRDEFINAFFEVYGRKINISFNK